MKLMKIRKFVKHPLFVCAKCLEEDSIIFITEDSILAYTFTLLSESHYYFLNITTTTSTTTETQTFVVK